MSRALQGHPARASEALLRRLPEDRAGQWPRAARSSEASPAQVYSLTCWCPSTPIILPLYRQSQIYAREGLELDRSTLADWVGGASALLAPLVQALVRYVLATYKLHGDDTPVPVLCPGRGTTKQGRLWTYVRDDRPAGSEEPPAVFFRYSPDRKGERPRAHLASFTGVLQADAFAGFDRLYGDRIKEAACWAHVRRKFFDIHAALASPIAAEALDRIGRLYGIEAEIRGRPPDERCTVRQARAGPELESLHSGCTRQ